MENTPLFFEKQPFSVRLTSDELAFCRENFDELFDGDTTIQPRKAFMLIAEKSLAKIKKNTESKPADLVRINELENKILAINADLEASETQRKQTMAQFNDLVLSNTNLQERYNRLSADYDVLKAALENPEHTEPVITERELLETERLLKLSPVESFILAQIESVHKTDAKGILIDRFFNVYQRRGNGDFDIKRITPDKYTQIVNHFKAQE